MHVQASAEIERLFRHLNALPDEAEDEADAACERIDELREQMLATPRSIQRRSKP